MKTRRATIWLLVLLFVGVSMLFYPTLADYINSKNSSKAISSYSQRIEEITPEEREKIISKAEDYNKRLASLAYPIIQYDSIEGYNDSLNIYGDGMMGYIIIDKIQIELPIYHGTDAGVLQKACGHVEGSSLPTGGVGTHTVLSAHRGLPSAKLFTNLDRMEIGDTFVLSVLGEDAVYQVDQIKTVTPDDANDLKIDPEKDYCTLLTCTPYGINTHRLLVRGVRIESEEMSVLSVTSEAYLVDKVIVASCVGIPIILGLIIYVWVKPPKKKIDKKYREGDEL